MRILSASVLALSFVALPALAHPSALPLAQGAETIEVTSTDLGDGIYMLEGRGGNIGLLTGDDGAFVIDSQFANISAANLAEIQKIAGEGPKFLVNTHWHGDHTGGNVPFNEAGAMIIAHDNVRGRLTTDQERVFDGETRITPAAPAASWPVVTFPEEMALHLNGQTVRLLHVANAHTDGDTIVHLEEANILHMGDVMFAGMFPYIDRTSGGTVDGYIAALDAAYDIADDETVVIPGHGALSTREDIKTLADMLRGAKAAVAALVADGKSREEALAARPLAAWADEWATGFMTEPRFTGIIYEDVAASQ